MNMSEMLNGIYELAVTAIVIMNMQEGIFSKDCWMKNNTRILAEYMPRYVR